MISLLALLWLPTACEPAPPDHLADAPAIAAKIDEFAAKNYADKKVKPAPPCSDADFLRRITLDLAGRTPTPREVTAFLEDKSADKRQQAIRRLMTGPEYPLHLGRVLDDSLQGKYAGDTEFLEYLRSSIAAHKPWDQMFRDMMLGPWDAKERKGSERFLVRRLASLDDMTNDTARVFFGVNISCAKCHDHPLVPDWKQDHYYGMESFFFRSQGGRNATTVSEKPTGDVQFVTKKGEKKTAKLMFLSGQVIDEPAAQAAQAAQPGQPPFSRRAALVKIALEEKQFFSRALVNRLWANYLGRGLVHPIDQMHSANPPSIPDLLEWLADDFADHGYDIDRLVAAIVSTRVYQQTSLKSGDNAPNADLFARAALRPLTPYQYAMSMVLVTGENSYEQADAANRLRKFRDLEGQVSKAVKADLLDRATDRYQASANEALYVSNHPDIQKLVAPGGNNLVARLAAMTDNKQVVETAILTILSRSADGEEREFLVKWLDEHKQDRAKALGEMVWALMTSAEFRFNH
jgi:hypothetical protein